MTLRRILAALVCAVLAPLAGAARPEITLNLKDVEIGSLIATVSEVTGKNFIVDGRVKGKVTVISASPMTPEGVYETFLAVLQVNGFAAIPAGEAIKIVPETNARTDGGTRSGSGGGLPMDEVVTHVYQINNISAAQLVPILRPMVAQWGHLAAYQASNMLIISDRASNVLRMERLIRQMDQAGDREIEYVHLQNASASEVVRILTTLTQQDKQADPSVRTTAIIADERSNSVLIGGDKSERGKFIEIIKQLDIPLKDDGATQVVYLRYASAENLAPILEGYAQQVGQAEKGAPGAAPASTPSGGGGAAGDRARVIADKDTNALIITAPPKAMRQIRDVIAQLDIERSQVLVEAIIAEVTLDRQSQLGIDWAVFNGNRIAAAGIMSSATLAAIGAIATSGNDRAGLAAVGQGLTLGGGSNGGDNGTAFLVLLKALKGDSDTNVLSTPTLVTLDNEEAKFSAGQEVPFLTGQFSSTGTGATSTGAINPFQTIERKDVGLTLGVTPQINEGNSIKLKLNLEVSQLAGNAASLNAVTTKRTLTNTVGVENGQILVIGGLIDDQLTDSNNGIPFLSSIPILGSLFQFRSVNKLKRNLMVFIRPSILRKATDGDYYTRRKYDAVRHDQIHSVTGAVPLVGGRRPILQDLEDYRLTAQPPEPPPPAPVQQPPPSEPPGGAAADNAPAAPAIPGPTSPDADPAVPQPP
ncbi:MAG TPA: type II secretion system secretin GspD [Solimonas sp.]|nr:type II secretion system secretin GspD [Solimonas sp.]